MSSICQLITFLFPIKILNSCQEFPGSLLHGRKVPILLAMDVLYSLSWFLLGVYWKVIDIMSNFFLLWYCAHLSVVLYWPSDTHSALSWPTLCPQGSDYCEWKRISWASLLDGFRLSLANGCHQQIRDWEKEENKVMIFLLCFIPALAMFLAVAASLCIC